jgi:hypothetical protein
MAYNQAYTTPAQVAAHDPFTFLFFLPFSALPSGLLSPLLLLFFLLPFIQLPCYFAPGVVAHKFLGFAACSTWGVSSHGYPFGTLQH